jgi:6-phosphogluconolactonase
MTKIEIAESVDALSQMVAEQFVRVTTAALRERGRCAVALSGGSTPKRVFHVLAGEPFRSRALWDQIDFFWGDERHVPVDHADSNYRMAAETLLSKVPVRPTKIHRIHGEIPDAALAAHQYEAEIRSTCNEPAGTPRFDLIVLGVGSDGHTASLFPGTPAVNERRRLCVENWVVALGAYRVTMTVPLINAARVVAFVASGDEKAAILRRVLRDRDAASPLPAQLVRPSEGELWWMLDRAAAGELS